MVEISKRNAIPPPHFPASTGEAIIHYADHDGRAVIGEGDTSFETRWSQGGSQSIYVLNDPPGIRGVAIAPEPTRSGRSQRRLQPGSTTHPGIAAHAKVESSSSRTPQGVSSPQR